LITVLMAVLAFYLAPMGLKESEQISLAQDELTEVDLIVAGQFQTFGGGQRVTYAERILSASGGERELANVFVALTPAGQASGEPPRIILADSARPEIDEATGARFMRLENVLQYDGTPGSGGFRVGQFDAQAIRLPPPPEFDEVLEESTLSTWSLLYSDDIAHRAELQWRISMLLLIPVIALIAVPMSRVSPRQGRFTKLLPAVLVYIGYFIALEFCRDRMADGDLSPAFGLWWVHGLFAAAGTVLFRAGPEGFRLRLPQSA
ncbi:MAG: LptF/LptG family permease, partial [Pseudomonadota bacterium]|nr:LptF/LptG family permease [Pseudomonadota bacterium]